MSSTIKVNNIQNLAGDDSGIDLSTNDEVKIKIANTNVLKVSGSSSPTIESLVSDGDIIFKGNDGGSAITALTLDMSDAGTAIFNSSVKIPDDKVFECGASTDLQIFHENGGANNIKGVNAHHLDLSTSNTLRMRIKDDGNVLVGTTNASPAESSSATGIRLGSNGGTQISVSGTEIMRLNRNTNDGTLINFCQASTSEGHISVSGTTVSYNGGHLSRYSRLTNDEQDTSIVKGTVMTNLDEMVEWSYEEVLWTDEDELPDGVSVGDVKTSAYTEDNEQLNKMAVSSVEGDANVAGVFVNWDNDDDFNDMNIAMTGDMVIRIAKGTTVARGDLLMSAGDGTAKPQDDDIVRSKTIAKVTSTNVSHTYDDGTYLVPCVLMAC